MVPVQLTTELGEIRIEVDEDRAPASAGYFLGDVRSGLYDGSSFFRIVTLTNQRLVERARKIAVIQGGLKHVHEDLPAVIPHETTAMTGLRHLQGTVSLARFAPGAVYHSFFICMRDEPALDFGGVRNPDGQGFAAFGKVTHGFEVAQKAFARAETQEHLAREIGIARVRIL